jgi:hypothetical protein
LWIRSELPNRASRLTDLNAFFARPSTARNGVVLGIEFLMGILTIPVLGVWWMLWMVVIPWTVLFILFDFEGRCLNTASALAGRPVGLTDRAKAMVDMAAAPPEIHGLFRAVGWLMSLLALFAVVVLSVGLALPD